jgi:Domain of unknown function (DUF4175)
MDITTDPNLRLQQLPLALRLSAHGAAFSLWLEQFLASIILPILALLGYSALAMMGVMTQLPGMIRVMMLGALLLWLAWRCYHAIRSSKLADARARLRRLEQAAHIPAGSLLLHVDAPVDGNKDHPFWQRAIAQVPQLRSWPWPRLAPLWQARSFACALLLLALCAGALIGGKQTFVQLSAAFSPWPTSLADVQISAVLRPPRYTDAPPQALLIRAGIDSDVVAIAGSDILITVTGVRGTLRLADVPLPLQRDGNSYAAAVPLKKNGRYALKNGWRTLATLDVRLRADGAPQLFFVQKPKITASQSLDVDYRYVDDYGLTSIALVATDGRVAEAQLLPKPQGTEGMAQAWRDFTPGHFAGKPVQLYLVGFDAQGHAGTSAPLAFALPERVFVHPVAQQIIGVRKGLFEPEPNFRSISNGLDQIARRLDSYDGNLTVFAALRMIRYRLLRTEADTQVNSSAGMLWQAALDLDGAGGEAALRDAFEAAQRSLRDGQNVPAALAALQRQLAKYMQENAQKGEAGEAQSINQEDVAQMLAEMQARLNTGDTASAQAMLEQLQQMMENMQQGGAGSAQTQAAQKALQQLRGISSRQQGVMAQTAATNITSAIVGADQLQQDLQKLTQEQQQLQQQLREVQSRSPALNEASAGMQDAAANLRQGASRQALTAQGRAMNGLQKAMAQLQQQASGKGARGGKRSLFDPLGRYNGGNLGPEYKLPTGADRQQAQEIRKLLQMRAADPSRSAAERAYILRLLKQF